VAYILLYVKYILLTEALKRHILNYTFYLLRSILNQDDPKTTRLKALGALNPHSERVQSPAFQAHTFFDPRDLVQVKYEMLRLVQLEGASKADAAALFGVSRPTYYQAEAAYAREGLPGLLPHRRGPKGAHKLDVRMMAFIEDYRVEHGPVGACRLAEVVQTEFGLTIHPRSIERALARKKKRQISPG
jgi:transposase